MRRLRAALLLAITLVAGCERVDVPPQQQSLTTAPPRVLPPFARSDARLGVAHRGIRRLEYASKAGPGLSFRESIATDGAGGYSIQPVALLESSNLDWFGFQMIQAIREGFHFRYRDFVVRDPALFVRNWDTSRLSETILIAGRTCERYRVERVDGDPVAFVLSVDEETGLILATDELDGRGELVASMIYETFELDPDPGSVIWHVASNSEHLLDTRLSLGDQVDMLPLSPRLLPSGYGLSEASTVSDGEGSWLLRVYSDGVQPLFFFQGLEEQSLGKAARLDGLVMGSTSSVVVYQVGAATAIQGTVAGYELMVIGKADQAVLLDLIESSLP